MAGTELSEYARRRAEENHALRKLTDVLERTRKALRGLPRSCPVHGREFAAAGLEPWGEPRCEQCKVPAQLTRILGHLDHAMEDARS
ncbi:hypothetical protein [Jiangella alkaliphila]|uniref:Uncharacterized protein n=1 Tax=Jiangella alkaliphila TaxID=419479 RepID=A0A1H2IES5_9ACTN|nr:hypothetical protein [Jiangella alkaliphila]SDU42358.1 hypothetical protein SAMN04488563_1643 [Jiangella alkaliphila]